MSSIHSQNWSGHSKNNRIYFQFYSSQWFLFIECDKNMLVEHYAIKEKIMELSERVKHSTPELQSFTNNKEFRHSNRIHLTTIRVKSRSYSLQFCLQPFIELVLHKDSLCGHYMSVGSMLSCLMWLIRWKYMEAESCWTISNEGWVKQVRGKEL